MECKSPRAQSDSEASGDGHAKWAADETGGASLVIMRGACDHISVGERVAFYRAHRGLTQAQVAAMVGRSEDWLSEIERGERDLRKLDTIVRLVGALWVSVTAVLGQPSSWRTSKTSAAKTCRPFEMR